MRFRIALTAALALILSACNFTLAEDITPPPGYTPPTPAPTLGPLFPAQPPRAQNGAAIFAEKCAPCHGATGLGDGKQGIQLGVTVPAIGLPEVARSASMAQWYAVVTQGNMERFMPPFASLSDQERWDVVAYAMTLHTSQEEIARGQELFKRNCPDCPTGPFTNQSKMAALSEVELARIIRQGNGELKAFGKTMSEDELWAVTAYLRTLPLDFAPVASAPTQAPTAGAAAAVPTDSSMMAEHTPVAAEIGTGTITGAVENRTGAALPPDLTVTLRGFEHGADPSTGPEEVFSREGLVGADGTFSFANVEIPKNRIFVAEVTVDGTEFQSGFAIVREGDASVSLPTVKLYPKTDDASVLVMDEVRIFLEYGTDTIQIYNVYSFRNPGEEIVVVSLTQNNEIPFLKPPAGAAGFGYEPMQGSESFRQSGNGFAIPPSEGTYGLIAFSSMPKERNFDYSQTFGLPTAAITLFLPEGVTAAGPQLTDQGVRTIQNFNFQIYEVDAVRSGEMLSFTVSGAPREANAEAASGSSVNSNLLIGAGALGLVLILGGLWMHLRGRAGESGTAEIAVDEFETPEDVMDAIIALDDLHRAGRITDEAHQKRRAELKEVLQEMLPESAEG